MAKTALVKPCRKCGKELPLTEFYTNKNAKDGYRNSCKNCDKKQARTWKDRNKEKYHEYLIKKRKHKILPEQYTRETIVGNTKYCSSCKQYVELSNFHKDSSNKYGLAYYCISCALFRGRKHYHSVKNTEEFISKNRERYLSKNYGLSQQKYIELLEGQNMACAICGIKLTVGDKNAHVDHCHKSGKVRAILCNNCNRGLGHFQENEKSLLNAADYIVKHKANVDSLKEDAK